MNIFNCSLGRNSGGDEEKKKARTAALRSLGASLAVEMWACACLAERAVARRLEGHSPPYLAELPRPSLYRFVHPAQTGAGVCRRCASAWVQASPPSTVPKASTGFRTRNMDLSGAVGALSLTAPIGALVHSLCDVGDSDRVHAAHTSARCCERTDGAACVHVCGMGYLGMRMEMN